MADLSRWLCVSLRVGLGSLWQLIKRYAGETMSATQTSVKKLSLDPFKSALLYLAPDITWQPNTWHYLTT